MAGKVLAEDEKHGLNISPHLVVIANNLFQKNLSGDKFKDRPSKYPIPEKCDKMFVPRCNDEIWNGERLVNSHFRDQEIILQNITMQISKATSAMIYISDLILKVKDSGQQLVSSNAYELQLNNLITFTVDSLSNLAKSLTDLNQCRKDSMNDQIQAFRRKLVNNAPAGSALLFEDDLVGHIKSVNNTVSLMKPSKILSK